MYKGLSQAAVEQGTRFRFRADAPERAEEAVSGQVKEGSNPIRAAAVGCLDGVQDGLLPLRSGGQNQHDWPGQPAEVSVIATGNVATVGGNFIGDIRMLGGIDGHRTEVDFKEVGEVVMRVAVGDDEIAIGGRLEAEAVFHLQLGHLMVILDVPDRPGRYGTFRHRRQQEVMHLQIVHLDPRRGGQGVSLPAAGFPGLFQHLQGCSVAGQGQDIDVVLLEGHRGNGRLERTVGQGQPDPVEIAGQPQLPQRPVGSILGSPWSAEFAGLGITMPKEDRFNLVVGGVEALGE